MRRRVQKPTDELGRSYVAFMRVNMDQIRQKLADEIFILTMLEVTHVSLHGVSVGLPFLRLTSYVCISLSRNPCK